MEQINPKKLMKEHSDIYWNMIYCFNERSLPIGFLIPYVDKERHNMLSASDFIIDDDN